jgi:UDP-N-acetyl-D-galactosamine dehydrogenase
MVVTQLLLNTKLNSLPFIEGPIAGHGIGVDPFYLAQKAQEVGYHPEIILAGRRLNDSMCKHVATEVVKHMMRKDLKVIDSKVLILGFTLQGGLSAEGGTVPMCAIPG